ncbi:MAG: transcriptional repressor of class stress s [Clostridia bacterium]|jgi:transcriptional regulator CtsR|nr:transcriptional repressor of class stress s [Clostridia bacterium]
MSRISDLIESFLNERIEERKGTLEIGRNEMANYFNCAPSQINYVLTTRFTSDRGYVIESRRGGGGFIKIMKINLDENDYLLKMLSERIGESVNKEGAFELLEILHRKNLIDLRIRDIIKNTVDDNTLSSLNRPLRDKLRAEILKAAVIAALVDGY